MERYRTQKHILVLEDDPSIAELLVWIFTDAGYKVTAVDSLRDARRACAEAMPDVIIADLLLPDGLGSDLIHDIKRARNGDSPASIVMSAVPQAMRHAEAAGAEMCITKSFDLARLLSAVESLPGSGSADMVHH